MHSALSKGELAMDDNGSKPVSDALASLNQVQELLAAHPGFRTAYVRPAPDLGQKASSLGRTIKEIRLLRFGAVFSRTLVLLHFKLHQQQVNTLVMDLHWHLAKVRAGWTVFIHFLDCEGNVCFQGDYSLDGEVPDALGFVYSRRIVAVPREVAGGAYRVRLGVWSPSESRHLPLSRVRGCHREPPGPYHNAVLLSVFTV
jgi:hypothetical protein